MLGIIVISDFSWSLLFPKLFKDILYTMLRSSRLVSYCTIIGFGLGDEPIEQRALIATSFVCINQKALSFESLCSSINVVALGVFFLLVNQEDYFIQIFSGLDVVKPSNDDRKLPIFLERNFLNSSLICYNFDSRTSFFDKLSHNISFISAYILLAKHELTIQVCKINSIHIHQMNLSYSAQRQIFYNLTPQSSCAHYQNRQIYYCFIVRRTFSPFLAKGCLIDQNRLEIFEELFQGKLRYLLH